MAIRMLGFGKAELTTELSMSTWMPLTKGCSAKGTAAGDKAVYQTPHPHSVFSETCFLCLLGEDRISLGILRDAPFGVIIKEQWRKHWALSLEAN